MKKVPAALLIALVVLLAGSLTTALFALEAHLAFRNLIAPNVSVAGIDLTGLDVLAASSTLQKAYDTMINNGITVTVNGEMQTLTLFASSDNSDVAYNLIDWDPNAAAKEALNIGHSSNIVIDSASILYYKLFGAKSFTADVTVNTDRLKEAILAAFPQAQIPAAATDFSVALSRSKKPTVTVKLGEDGQTLDLSTMARTVRVDAIDLVLKPLNISTIPLLPSISQADAETLIPAAVAAVLAAPYTVTGTDTTGEVQTWNVSQKTITDWIVPTQKAGLGYMVALQPEKMVKFLTSLHTTIDVSSQNARFTIDGGKVSEFQGSKDGNVIDDDAFFLAFVSALGTATAENPISIVTRTEIASVTTENVNSLGITEVVGEAITTFPHSTANRAQNIKHGAEKLNGILVAPGETVSTLALLRPFTLEDGYVSELVIKGDEIKAEVGGGLCQLGTTMFRSVMATGLEVVDRRNHSLAISYYDDLTNGNPGTDATLYDPAPDFKFKNDMPTYVLLITTFSIEDHSVTFTFWGTKDGRSGSYTPPEVLTKIPVGSTQYKDTATLRAGTEQCQNAFPGYTTTFDYNITYADGTTKTVPFLSSYRALPKICLRGTASAVASVDASLSLASEATRQ